MANSIALATAAGAVTIKRDQPMSLHTTFRIGGPADFLARVASLDQILAALAWADREGVPITAIGGGSNLLVGDGGIRGLVLLVRAPGKAAEEALGVQHIGGDEILLTVPAQAPLSWLGHLTAGKGWAGLEWAAGLPGVVGGGVVNNAGAHGAEITDHLESFQALTLDGSVETWSREDLAPSYRRTVLKVAPRPRQHIVLNATFRLPLADSRELAARADENARYRRQTQPTGACAGSVFTNPADTYAGYLIERAGLKGRQIGGVKISPLHGNFLVNTGDARAAEVREIIALVQDQVEREFGIRLVPEIEQIGEP